MTQHPHTPPPAVQPDRTHWTPAKQRLFLAALLETGNVSHAARTVGMSPSSAHRLRQRMSGTVFSRAWDGALKFYASHMADPFLLESRHAAPAQAPR